MNTDANSQNNALLNRMILLVLSLILVCLVLLVVRAYTSPSSQTRPTSVAEAPTVPEESIVPGVGTPIPATMPAPARRTPPVPTAPTRMASRSSGEGGHASSEVGTDNPLQAQDPALAVSRIDSAVVGVPPIFVGNPGFTPDVANAEVLGVATLIGQPPKEIPIPLTPACGRLNRDKNGVTTRHYVVNSEGRLANVLVYISAGLHSKYPDSASPVLLNQIGCMYQPYVLGMQARQPGQVRNSDNEMHNVHFTPRNNPERNFVQLKGQVNPFTFENPELFLRVKCDVHPWMFAYLGVFDHPFFSVTDTNGVFHLPNGLPAGHYTLSASHLKAGTLSQEIDFRPGERNTALFQFPVPGKTQAMNTP